MKIYKMGEGPVYTFYRPYHLSPFETPMAVARAVLFCGRRHHAARRPGRARSSRSRSATSGKARRSTGSAASRCTATSRTPTYARSENLLPIGLTDGARLVRDLPIDAAITFDDVVLPPDRVSERLWREQDARFGRQGAAALASG